MGDEAPPPNITDAIKTIRVFNGYTDPSIFIRQLVQDIATFHLTKNWVLENLDRFLTGSASDWWSSVEERFNTALVAANANVDLIWTAFSAEFSEYFGNEIRIDSARNRLRLMKFNLNTGVPEYVTEKVALCHTINPAMTFSDILDQLIRGLPKKLQIHLISANCTDVPSFQRVLRRFIHFDPTFFDHDAPPQFKNNNNNPSNNNNRFFSNTFRPNSYRSSYSNNSSINSGQSSSIPPPRNSFTSEGRPICNYCFKPNHLASECRLREMHKQNNYRQMSFVNQRPTNWNGPQPQYSQNIPHNNNHPQMPAYPNSSFNPPIQQPPFNNNNQAANFPPPQYFPRNLN
jgi:Retrotransposon gag protein